MSAATYRFTSNYVRRQFAEEAAQAAVEGEARGEVKGEAKAVLLVLEARGVEVPDEVRTRITACTDSGQLETWLRRAGIATKIHDLGDELLREG